MKRSGCNLVIFSGLPGVGKTTLAKGVALEIQAAYIRIDSIEQAMARSVLNIESSEDAGYLAAYDIAKDNLRLGLNVVSDSVNSISLTRDDWFNVGKSNNAHIYEIEIICSDKNEHKRRVEERVADIQGHKLPEWSDVIEREYEEWDRDHLVVDTAFLSKEESKNKILEYIKVN